MSVINSFDKFAKTNVMRSVDLSQYQTENVSHNVKPAGDYKLLLRDRIVNRGNGDPTATVMPFNYLRGKFELRQHETTIWTGYKGHGKSLVLSQVFMAALKRGKKAFILSPEFRPETFLERMLYQHCRTTEPTAEHLNEFFEFLLDRMWLYDAQASLKPDDVVALCRYVADKIQPDHIMIDSLMKCGIGPDDYAKQKQFVDSVQSVAHANPLHIHLVAHARKANDDSKPARLHDIKGASEIADMAENVISVWRNKEKEKNPGQKHDEPDASLTVEAQRNGDGWIGTVNLLHDPETQLFFEPGNQPEGATHVRF